MDVREDHGQMMLDDYGVIELRLVGDVYFEGYDPVTGQSFSGRAGGGDSVTFYERESDNYFQYAVADGDECN